MMNYVWLFLIAIAVIVGALTGNIEEVTKSAMNMAGTAVQIALGLIGIMTLWLGMMKIAEEAGMIRLLAKALIPISKRLFPDVPPEHPAIGSMMLNISANWLGLGNAATPFGIKAMEQLQELNDQNPKVLFTGLQVTCHQGVILLHGEAGITGEFETYYGPGHFLYPMGHLVFVFRFIQAGLQTPGRSELENQV